MKKPPVQIARPQSATSVTIEVKRLLRAAGVKDKIPTPKAEILACARLVETGELDLSEYESSFSEKARDVFHRTFAKIRGFLDRRSEVCYVDPMLPDSRKLFTTYHEVSHRIFEWQRIVCTQDDDETLSFECKNLFESEANFGAAEILFQCERFEIEARDYQPDIPSALYLADKYGASRHATLRRFAERNRVPCILLVLVPTSRENSDGGTSFYVVYSIPSESFIREFGDPLDLTYINPDHEIGEIINDGGHGEIVLLDLKGFERVCVVESHWNGYRQFVLIRPKEIRHSRHIVRFQS
jgi:Zn-dependent peptidase ImmA (M78 family)